MTKNILITGGRGFIGFNALQLWTQTNSDIKFVNLDAHTYADKFLEEDKDDWLASHGIPTYVWDLGDEHSENYLKYIIEKHEIDTVIHYGAESHVDNSIRNPNIFFHSNVMGTVHLLNVVKEFNLRMHVIGTDEVYGITKPEDNAYENAPLKPSSPYSSSKCSEDLISLSYFHTFGSKITVSHCTNSFGKWQHDEKLIPTVIRHALRDEKIPVYGNGLQRRHWITTDDHNSAVLDIVMSGELGKTYNIAPPDDNYLSNMDIIKFILDYLEKPESLIEHITDRLGHDTSYFLKSEKYNMKTSFEEYMPEVIEWYKKIYNS